MTKWKTVVEPNLPFELKDKTILELGCNAGLYMIHCVDQGAAKCIGIEPLPRFQQQLYTTLDVMSNFKDFDYRSKIQIEREFAHEVDMSNFNPVDLTLALNVMYWLIFEDESGEFIDWKNKLKKILSSVASVTDYLLIVGDESIFEHRNKNHLNLFGSNIENTIPYLDPFFRILKKDIVEVAGYKLGVILARSRISSRINSQGEISVPYTFSYFVEGNGEDGDEKKWVKPFFLALEDFINGVMSNTLKDLTDTPYFRWIERRVKEHGVYDNAKDRKGILKRVWHDIEIIMEYKKYGVKEPIIFQEREDGTYKLIEGHHRLTIYKILGKDFIPATIVGGKERDFRVFETENINSSSTS